MTRDETIALFLKGKDEWNRWAGEMLAERKALEKDGEWAAETDIFGNLVGKNDKTQDWITRAAAEPEEEGADGDAPVKSIDVADDFDCSGFIFPATAFFSSAQFHADAIFSSAQFHADADFESASFAAATYFRDAAFGTTGKPADADFTGIKVERAFDLTGATFSKVPAFNQADFAQPPDLDDVSYPISGFWRRGNRDDIAKYRHLRRIALGDHNHEAEAMAFKGEVRAKRGTVDRWWHAAFWFGVLYDAFSNFGRSLVRPFFAWLGLTFAAALAFFLLSPAVPGGALAKLTALAHAPPCHAPARNTDGPHLGGLSPDVAANTNTRTEALHLAFHNAFVILGVGESTHRSYGCLYGVELYGNGDPRAVVPPWVATVGALQKLFSAVLIFLFLLATRNLLKLK